MRESLRESLAKENGKFLIDLIEFSADPKIRRAIQYVTNNTLVGENPEIARHLAYNLVEKNRFDAVAYDGTLFKKNGVICSGSWYCCCSLLCL